MTRLTLFTRTFCHTRVENLPKGYALEMEAVTFYGKMLFLHA